MDWDNRRDLQREFFHKFAILSESSSSKEYFEELEGNTEKLIHGFCQEHDQLQKPLSYFT